MVQLLRQHERTWSPVLGLDYSAPSTLIDSRATPACNNVRFWRGAVEKAGGGEKHADTGDNPLDSAVMLLGFVNEVFFAHTLESVYTYNTSTGEMDDISDDTYGGDEDDPVSSCYVGGYYVFSNTYNQLKKWNFTDATVEDLSPDGYKARWVGHFGGRLLLFAPTETGTDYPRRVRWTTPTDPTDFSGEGSGFADLAHVLGDSDTIVRAERLGSHVIVYGDHSIARQRYTEVYYAPFVFSQLNPTLGLIAPQALVNIDGRKHIFLGEDNVYVMSSGGAAEPIGDKVREEMFDTINMDVVNRSFMVLMPDRTRIRLFVPSAGNESIDTYFEYNLAYDSWAKGTRSYSAAGEHRTQETVTWDSVGGVWDDKKVSWDSTLLEASAPTTVFGDSDGVLYVESEELYDLAGSAISAYWETKDIVTGEHYKKTPTEWYQLDFEAKGHSVDVYYSTNEGSSFTFLQQVTLSDDWERYEVELWEVGEQIRFRFENTRSQETFALRWFEVGYITKPIHEAADEG